MGIFGFGSTTTPAVEEKEDVYAPMEFEETIVDDNVYEKMPDFMSSISFDAAKLQPTGLHGGIDFLQVEDHSSAGGASLAPSRGWTDDLCYGTGTTYLAGLTLGGAYGMAEGLRKSSGAENAKVRLNTTLNTITRRGPGLGNAVGVVAMLYNGSTAFLDYCQGTHNVFSSIGGGAIAGAIFKSTAGPRAIAISSAVCAGVGGAWSLLVSMWTDQ
ncbi:Tim17/Tim22/Tim23/Pmp24 family-domain-containing protein [Phycomyces nitens]|nr:Tim17/Tim22/Tim23/Pmp24 family-domain-containing protein [Phycomyces nitens]